MKMHSGLNDKTMDLVKEQAIALGLDAIDYESYYKLYKIGTKSNFYEEPVFTVKGHVSLIGSEKHVALYIQGLRDWFRTSSIVSCEKKGKDIIIQTANSIYKLSED
jgi:hypothetical protein